MCQDLFCIQANTKSTYQSTYQPCCLRFLRSERLRQHFAGRFMWQGLYPFNISSSMFIRFMLPFICPLPPFGPPKLIFHQNPIKFQKVQENVNKNKQTKKTIYWCDGRPWICQKGWDLSKIQDFSIPCPFLISYQSHRHSIQLWHLMHPPQPQRHPRSNGRTDS